MGPKKQITGGSFLVWGIPEEVSFELRSEEWVRIKGIALLWTELCPFPPNSYVEVQSVFGNVAFKEVMKVKQGQKGGILIQ